MKTKLLTLVAALLLCGWAPVMAQKDEAKFCRTFDEFLAGKWTSVSSLLENKDKVCEMKFKDNELRFKTGEKAADKVLRKEALVLKYAGHLYVNCRNLDCNTFSLDCNNYAQAFLYGGNKLLFAAYKINDAALLGSLAVDIVGIATPGVPGAATLVASDVIWYGAKDLVGFRCYLLEKSNEDGEAMVEGLNDDFMENLLKGNDALLRRYKSSEKKNDRLSASHILPILREKGLIKE